MTLRSLEVFLAVVEGGSMRAAAERLYISQPSVSGVVADLEDEYGVRLFERLGKKLCITQEGEQLAGYARRMLSLNEEIGRQMHCAGIRTPLRLGASMTVASGIMAELAGRVQGPSPYVYVANTGIIEQKILRNELDVGIVEGHIKSEDLLVTPMMPDRLVLVCRPDHWCSGRDSIRLRELEAERLILREPAGAGFGVSAGRCEYAGGVGVHQLPGHSRRGGGGLGCGADVAATAVQGDEPGGHPHFRRSCGALVLSGHP